MSLKSNLYRHFQADNTVPCDNRPGRCEHWDKCKTRELACPTFRAWITRTRFPVLGLTPEERFTPTTHDFLRIYHVHSEEEELETYLLETVYARSNRAGRPAELAAWRTPPPGVSRAVAADDVLRDSPPDGGAVEQLAAPSGVDPALGGRDRTGAQDAWGSLTARRDLR